MFPEQWTGTLYVPSLISTCIYDDDKHVPRMYLTRGDDGDPRCCTKSQLSPRHYFQIGQLWPGGGTRLLVFVMLNSVIFVGSVSGASTKPEAYLLFRSMLWAVSSHFDIHHRDISSLKLPYLSSESTIYLHYYL